MRRIFQNGLGLKKGGRQTALGARRRRTIKNRPKPVRVELAACAYAHLWPPLNSAIPRFLAYMQAKSCISLRNLQAMWTLPYGLICPVKP